MSFNQTVGISTECDQDGQIVVVTVRLFSMARLDQSDCSPRLLIVITEMLFIYVREYSMRELADTPPCDEQ